MLDPGGEPIETGETAATPLPPSQRADASTVALWRDQPTDDGDETGEARWLDETFDDEELL